MDEQEKRNLAEYYEAMFDMFSTDGWKYFMEDMLHVRQHLSDSILTEPLSVEMYNFKKGALDKTRDILLLENTLTTAYEELKNNADI